jgi:hypothetical protein
MSTRTLTSANEPASATVVTVETVVVVTVEIMEVISRPKEKPNAF